MFHLVETKSCLFQEPYLKSLLQKWDMVKGGQYMVVRYTKYYHKLQARELAMDLLNDAGVRDTLKVLLKNLTWLSISEPVTGVDVEVVPTTVTRMDMFDKLLSAEPPIVRHTGDIVKCMDEVHKGFQVSDMLRDMLLAPESENAELLSSEERSELLWRLFEAICLGGPCCQFEDKLEPYFDCAKKLYKELVSVQKNTATGKVEVACFVYRLKSFTTASGHIELFPAASRNNFCYIAVDPLRRLCKIWYHAFVPYW